MKRILVFVMLAISCVYAHSQAAVISGQAINIYGQPSPFATVRVCSVTSSGTPCTPTAPIYLDYNLSIPAGNPYTSDQYGNYTVYAPALATPNLYVVQLTPAAGVTWSYVNSGPYLSAGGGTISGNLTANIFNATVSPYYEINGSQITSAALADQSNIAFLASGINIFAGTISATGYDVSGVPLASTNLSDTTALAYLASVETFTATQTFVVGAITTTIGNSGVVTSGDLVSTGASITGNMVNATTYEASGSVGATGYCLTSAGGSANTWSPCLTSASLFYQTVDANGSAQTQRPSLNFASRFALTDSASPARTTVDLATTAVTAGSYTNTSLTVDAYGRITAASTGGSATVHQAEMLEITSGICSTGSSASATCTMSSVSWPTAFADTSYAVTCQSFPPTSGLELRVYVVGKTASTVQLELQNGQGSAAAVSTTNEIDCLAIHN